MNRFQLLKYSFPSALYAFLVFSIILMEIGCSRPRTDKKNVYHIIGENEKSGKTHQIDPLEPPIPPAPFYGAINLVLFGESDVYLHRVSPKYYIDPDFTDRPMEVALTQWDVKKIELKKLPEFLATEYQNVSPELYRQYFTCIKSSSDTITNEAFPVIREFFQSIKFDRYIIRKWTAQEKEAIISAIKN